MAQSTIKKYNNFRGPDGSRVENLGAVSNFTPSKDGWARVSFTTSAAQTIPPVCTAAQNNQIVGYGQGLGTANTTASFFFPVKAGLEYSITIYRAEINTVALYY